MTPELLEANHIFYIPEYCNNTGNILKLFLEVIVFDADLCRKCLGPIATAAKLARDSEPLLC